MNNNQIHFTPRDFEVAFQDNLSEFVKQKIIMFNFLAQTVSAKEKDEILLKIIKTLLDPQVIRTGRNRQLDWERGWAENLEAFKNQEPKSIIPHYFGKYDVVRWKQQFLRPKSPNFELNMLAVIEYWLFDKYLKPARSIYEFGCGTGHNLLRVREINRKAEIVGLDWAHSSQEIIKMIRLKKADTLLSAKNYDFFKPDISFKLHKASAVYTVAALEQLGDKFQPFIDFLLEQRPEICLHIEPIGELLDGKNLVDYLSILYFQKRNYLNGFLLKLQELEKQEKIKIHIAKRSFIGSLYVDGYSVIVWSPIYK